MVRIWQSNVFLSLVLDYLVNYVFVCKILFTHSGVPIRHEMRAPSDLWRHFGKLSRRTRISHYLAQIYYFL